MERRLDVSLSSDDSEFSIDNHDLAEILADDQA